MVSTRHTRPPNDSQPSMSTRHQGSRRPVLPRALRNLVIDGNDSLKGRRDSEPQAHSAIKVYHYRGAVYAVDENTPKEWIEAQPKRYLKRKRDDHDDDDDDNNEDSDDDSEEEEGGEESDEEAEEQEEEERPTKRRATSHAVRKQQRNASERRSKSTRRDTITPAPTRSQPRSPPSHPATPQSTQSRGRRGRPPKNALKTVPTKSTQHAAQAINATSRSQQVTNRFASSQLASEQDHVHVPPISWADMMAGRIAVSMTKFLAVQKQLRKLQQEYSLARALHARVVARESTKTKAKVGSQDSKSNGRRPNTADDMLVTGSSGVDADRLKVGASVQRTDSRLSRREDQPMNLSDHALIEIAASDDGNRDRASSFNTAPSQVDSSPNKQSDASREGQTGQPTDATSSLEALLSNGNRAEHDMLAEKILSKETPEEKSRRLNHEWDKVMAWPQRNV